jgi:hypothetical protein
MRTKKHPPFYISVLLLFFTLLSACEEKPDFIGRELLPSGDDFTVYFDSLEVTHGYTKSGDSIRASFREKYLIGSILDPFYGGSNASLVTTITSSSSSGSFGHNPVADSVILFFEWQEYTGEGSLPMQFHVHEFLESIQFDSAYYSNWDISGKYKEPPIGSAALSYTDTLVKVNITDQEFIDKFLTAADSILSNRVYFQELIKGLYYTTDDAADEGGIFGVNFDLGENQLMFYYHNDTANELSQEYSLANSENGRIPLFSHDVSGYPLEEYLNNGSDNDSMIFVQSMGGVSSVIQFPELTQWLDSMPVAINEARLIIPIADTNLTQQQSKDFCEYLELYLINEDGTYARTYDYLVSPESFGGLLERESWTYSFTIKVQLQSIFAGDVENLSMILIAGNSVETVKRSSLYGWNTRDASKRIRLEITYTLL